jgi:spermidine/putrescine transport system permease protein
MRRRQELKSRKLLSGPYLFWAASFIIIPLLMILYYGLTDKNGNFTLMNLAQITKFKSTGTGTAALFREYAHLPDPCLPACHDPVRKKCQSDQFHCTDLHSSHVDEFSAADTRMAESAGKKRCHQYGSALFPSSGACADQHTVCDHSRHGIQFLVLPIYNVLSKIDRDVISAARDLGANNLQTFLRIILPLSVPGIISGITMVFVPSLTTFVISDLLGGSKILLIGNVIEQEFKQGSNWNTGSGLSLVLMIFIIASMAMIAKYDKEGEGTAF